MVPIKDMEKRRPSFALDAFKAVGGDPLRLAITTTALLSAAESGFDRVRIAELIRSMRQTHFYKSMTSYRDHRRWQDVYHVPWEGMVVYVKFTDDAVTEFTVLSFKEQ
jgi:motility quorum-sensing regulator/GCU-specific mRNA interferase toxin